MTGATEALLFFSIHQTDRSTFLDAPPSRLIPPLQLLWFRPPPPPLKSAEWMGVKWVELCAVSQGPLISRSFLIHEHFPIDGAVIPFGPDSLRPAAASLCKHDHWVRDRKRKSAREREKDRRSLMLRLPWVPLVSHQELNKANFTRALDTYFSSIYLANKANTVLVCDGYRSEL